MSINYETLAIVESLKALVSATWEPQSLYWLVSKAHDLSFIGYQLRDIDDDQRFVDARTHADSAADALHRYLIEKMEPIIAPAIDRVSRDAADNGTPLDEFTLSDHSHRDTVPYDIFRILHVVAGKDRDDLSRHLASEENTWGDAEREFIAWLLETNRDGTGLDGD